MGVQQIMDDLNKVKELEIERYVELRLAGHPIRWHDFSKLSEGNQIELVKQYANEPAEI